MRACILGCASTVLDDEERRFFSDADPFGFILFARNCVDDDQMRRLVEGLRESVGREAPVLIDEEGGRVQRMKPPQPYPRFVPLSLSQGASGGREAPRGCAARPS